MGKVDFFQAKCRTDDIEESGFGICDDTIQPWAYPDYLDKSKWIVSVRNAKGQKITFIAVDKCLDIRDDEKEKVSTCDAILTQNDSIVFVELKDRDPPWIAKAMSQLKSTIDIFSKNHDISKFKHKRAFASNKKYPGYSYQMQDEMDDFRRETKVRLVIEAIEIVF
jgi:hypothetical protein